MDPVRLVCVDVDGTISDRFQAPVVPGAAAALDRIRSRFVLKLVTNATSRPHASLARALCEQGLLVDDEELVTPATAARRVLTSRGDASGLLLVDDATRQDFEWFGEDAGGRAVVLGTEGHSLTIADLQPAFRMLLGGATLYTLQQNRYFRQGDRLVTDLGPLAAFLAYAANCRIFNLGKPSPLLFEQLTGDAGCRLEQTVMVGDDAEFDAAGSVALGMRGVLVRTGKYRSGDESRVDPAPTATLESIVDLPGWLETLGT